MGSTPGDPKRKAVIGLEYAFTYQADLAEPIAVGDGPYGTRLVVEVVGGRVEGEGLRGTILTGGADWLLAGADGYGRLDVRAQIRTEDGAAIYLKYTVGLLELNEAVRTALDTGSGTDFGDHYFRTSPQFETGDPRYAWLNQTVFVGEGRILAGRKVEYRVYRVT